MAPAPLAKKNRGQDMRLTPANSAAKTLSAALAWARKDDPRPFFLLVHSYEVHSYFLDKPEHHAFARRELPAYQEPFKGWGIRDLKKPAGPQVIDALLGATADDIAYVKALYRGALAGLDAEVGRFAGHHADLPAELLRRAKADGFSDRPTSRCGRSVRVPTLMVVVIRGAPMAWTTV